jgi:uncharacterized protein
VNDRGLRGEGGPKASDRRLRRLRQSLRTLAEAPDTLPDNRPVDYPDYNPSIDPPPLSDEELDALDQLLVALPGETAMNVEGLDGYLTALLVGPRLLPRFKSADWMPAVWGGDGAGSAPFTSQKQRKRTALLVLRHLRTIDRQLSEAPAAWEPVFSVAESAQGELLVDAEDWCIGFLQAVQLDPAAWAPLFDDGELGAALVPLALLGGDDSELGASDRARLEDPVQRDALSRAVVDAVLKLQARRTTPSISTTG